MGQAFTAFEMLLDIDQRCRQLANELPSQEARLQTWSGIGFGLAGQWYVAPMGEVAEVLHEPHLTRMPGVKAWVLGVANLRGRLLPVMDLCGLFGQEPSSLRKQRRVLVVDHGDLFVGLLVDEVLGLQHFALHSLDLSPPAYLQEGTAPYIQGHFHREQDWRVFSPLALVQAPGFINVAL
ncbi:MAG: chemotaxis protein CheW [Pseudomonas sp.]|uniref:chemotaxis protein CheW n=1 Tax=Pseudomonas abieticivorans TaxID=2931382 RepID=UPI0020C07E27|nr:chemotaxis protein CheW [Pseudomonas sp. PIA16]MDE1168495.1 chemotaxis protein CheW [Pseudomonas sp.]